VTTLCLNPLDLLKIKFQVDTGARAGGIGNQIFHALRDVQRQQGWRGLYRGISPNIAGNASSWGLYFFLFVFISLYSQAFWCDCDISYNLLKKQTAGGDITKPLSAAQYLMCSAEASAGCFSPLYLSMLNLPIPQRRSDSHNHKSTLARKSAHVRYD